MAYAVSLAQTIDQILSHSAQYSFPFYDKQQIRTLHEYANFLQEFLEEFPEKAKNLEAGLRELANKAEDVLENLMLSQIHQHEYNKLLRLRRVAEEIDPIVDSLTEEVMEIKNRLRTEDVQFGTESSSAAASSSSRLAPTSHDVMVGFDEDLLAINTRLCGGPSKLQVIPIVGMAGIGKTTLARNAYSDPFVMEYFDIRAWVTVSQDYSAEQIVSGLLALMKDFIKKSKGQDNNEDEKVYKCLKGWRYLIIMDDMWNTEAWNVVRHVFPDDNNGSRIILTTRLSQIAAYADPCSSPHEMLFMDADQSWNLLQQRVYVDQDCPLELEEIGKMIAGNCKGLPLVIVAVAGLLSVANLTPTSWHEIAGKVKSGGDGQIDEILSLSYTQLPHRLRPCFLHLGCFPEDSEICVSKLIRLWVAEGFLKCENEGEKSLEVEAEECLEDLVKRNLVLVGKRKSNGKIKSCSLHDLMRDLCIRKAKEEEFLVYLGKESCLKNHRRVVHTPDALPRLSWCFDASSIHTIIMHFRHSRHVNQDFFTSVRLLRVLDSEYFRIDWPGHDQLFEQFHLRYLAFNPTVYGLRGQDFKIFKP